MNGFQPNERACSYEKSVPGCLGRVANLFDLNSGVTRSKLLTERPHRDGSNLSRSLSDVSIMSSPIARELGDKMVVSEMNRSSSTRKSEGTSVKMLIAQEMSKELESRHDSPNVVAKLMGLDAPPHQQELPDLAHGRRNPKFHLRASYSEIPSGYWHQEDGFIDGEIDCQIHQCQEQHNCKDTYEMWQSSLNTNYMRSLSLQNGRCSENVNEQKMALVRQKFMDAKRLSTDENLRQTKEFQDAVDVLSSNQHLFLKVLQEPNSLISHHLYGKQPIPLPNETKRITVLKPSKMVFNDKFPASGNRNEKQVKKSCPRNRFGLSPVASTRRVDDSSTQQPTRIVVLKPTPGMIHDVMAAVPSIPSSPTNLQRPNFFEVPGDDESREAREVAKEITQQMRENLAGHQRNETILSSVLSYGYTGDESSFNKSEAEFVGNVSDSEVMSPVFKHSWDYINQNGAPYSSSSLSHASYTPESSVAREAKKRLSERWAVMASNGTCLEQRHVRRSASTLGEMLALSDIKKPKIFEVDDTKRDQDHRVSTSCLISNADGVEIESPRSLLRSKSLPVNSMASHQRLGGEALDREARKMDGSTKQATKSSFRGKVTSLFFQRSKKPCKGKTDNSQSQDKAVSNHTEASVPCGMPCDNNSEYRSSEEIQSSDLQSANRNLWLELNDEPRQGISPQQVPWSTLKPATPGMSSEIQDQPSPISVLEATFEEDATIPNQLGKQPAFSLGRSNLIDKSPPIGSIARTLSWDESSAQADTSNPLKSPFLSGGSHEEGNWLFLIQSLLSAAGVENDSQLLSSLTRWHSPESPLNPLLREKYVNLISKEPFYEANRRQLRSNCWLVFDSVNGVLVELPGMGSNATKWVHEKRTEITLSGDLLTDKVWAKLKHSNGRSSSRESLRSSHRSNDIRSPSLSRDCVEPLKDVNRFVPRNGASEVEEGELQLDSVKEVDNLDETVLAKEACIESEPAVDEEEQLRELEAGEAEIAQVRNDTPAISESSRDGHIVTVQRGEDKVENDVIVPQSEDIAELSTQIEKDKGKGVIICSSDEVEFGRTKSLFEQNFIASRKEPSEGPNTRGFEFLSCSNGAKADKVNKGSHNEGEGENKTLESLDLSLCLPNVSVAAPSNRYSPRPNSAPCIMSVQSLPTPLCTGSDGLTTSEEHTMAEESGSASQKNVHESDFINSIVGCVVSEPIEIIAFKFTEMADESIACLKEGIQEIIMKEDQQTQFHSLQGVLNSRSDLTLETLLKSHHVQLEILVAIKTGVADFLRNGQSIPLVDLAEIFLNLKCRNPECGRELTVDECECKFCSRKDGFCSMCMCLVCSKFDSESNTCGWVGCDSCSHWCHANCGLQKSYIRNGPSVSSAQGTSKMLFYCLACDHKSEMFGFVKDVFKTCAADWKDETMIKELEYIKRIFAASNDTRGKTLHCIASESLVILNPYYREYALGNLDKIYISRNVLSACRLITSFLKESDDSMAGSASAASGQKKPEEPMRRETTSTGPSPAQNVMQRGKELVVDDEVETLVKMIQGEAKMLESRAEDARRKAEILKGIAMRKRKKIDEEYTARMAKLHKLLAPAEEERRKKMEELQLLERSYQEYMKTQIRMREDINNLCRTMGKPLP